MVRDGLTRTCDCTLQGDRIEPRWSGAGGHLSTPQTKYKWPSTHPPVMTRLCHMECGCFLSFWNHTCFPGEAAQNQILMTAQLWSTSKKVNSSGQMIRLSGYVECCRRTSNKTPSVCVSEIYVMNAIHFGNQTVYLRSHDCCYQLLLWFNKTSQELKTVFVILSMIIKGYITWVERVNLKDSVFPYFRKNGKKL